MVACDRQELPINAFDVSTCGKCLTGSAVA